MAEITASATIRDAFDRAHAQRGQALREAWAWLFARPASRVPSRALSR